MELWYMELLALHDLICTDTRIQFQQLRCLLAEPVMTFMYSHAIAI